MLAFQLVSVGLAVLTALSLVATIYWRRHLLLKPSILVALAFHIRIQIAAAIYADEIFLLLPRPWVMIVLAHVLPLLITVGGNLSADRTALVLWRRLIGGTGSSYSLFSFWVLAFVASVLLAVYLSAVPVRSTGLVAILTNPEESAEAREESLKLIPRYAAYAFFVLAQGVVPLMAGLCAVALHRHLARGGYWAVLKWSAVFGVLVVIVSLTGARSFPANTLLVLIFAFFMQRTFKFEVVRIGLAIIVVLAIPVVLSLARQDRKVTVSSFGEMLQGPIIRRTFYTPMETGLLHVHYAQTQGHIGVAGIPRLARAMGVVPIQASSVIAMRYRSNRSGTALVNTSFVFSYYLFFGILVFPFLLAGVWILDLTLVAIARVPRDLLVPSVAALSTRGLILISSNYTTLFVTHGLLPTLALVSIVSALARRPPAATNEVQAR